MKRTKSWFISIVTILILVMTVVGAIAGVVLSQETNHSESDRGESQNEDDDGEGRANESGSDSGGEETGTALALNATYDEVRRGARLELAHDATSNRFNGIVHNTTKDILQHVRIEVHLSNGVELGPTKPIDLAPDQQAYVILDATNNVFDSWSTHVEVGLGEHGGRSEGCQVSEGSGEHGSESGNRESETAESNGEGKSETAGPECDESGERGEGGSRELNEAAMSSPITPLGQSWDGIIGDLAVSMQYDGTTRSITGTVENISTQTLCYVQAEPHLKSGGQTVAELGPEILGDLKPGQEVNSSLSLDNEPSPVEIVFDGYVIHMEVFDCNGPGPIPHSGGEGAERGNEGGESGDEHGNREGRGEHGNREDRGEQGNSERNED